MIILCPFRNIDACTILLTNEEVCEVVGMRALTMINLLVCTCRKVVSSNTSHLETHAGFFKLFMKGIFDP